MPVRDRKLRFGSVLSAAVDARDIQRAGKAGAVGSTPAVDQKGLRRVANDLQQPLDFGLFQFGLADMRKSICWIPRRSVTASSASCQSVPVLSPLRFRTLAIPFLRIHRISA